MTAAVNNTRRITAVAFALGALALFPVSAAQAAAPATQAAAPAQSCWYNVDNDTMGCFDASLDPQEQIELVTGSDLIAVPTGTQQRVAPSAAADPVTYLLATGWDAVGQTGVNFSYFTANAAICNGLSHSLGNLGVWNNRFESFVTYNGCEGYLYDSTDYFGTEFGPVVNSTNLGTFRNRAESMIVE